LIKQLPKEVYDLIAAGEVVLAPVSVVKELVENSIDAGAGRISVDIKAGGTERIRVSDNGSGIANDEVGLAFKPHATSKLRSAQDLTRIETLGFRGEALASIAAVSDVVMITKTKDEQVGVRAETGGDTGLTIMPAGADTGTVVIVERLFFNIPARKKQLSGARSEERTITEYLSKAAVSRPDIAFRLTSDGKTVFSTPGAGDRLAAIASAYGSKVAQNLVPINSDQPGMRLEGHISGVLGLRSNRKGQHYFVNGRPVKNATIEEAVGRAYREFAEPGRFPVVFIFLTADPALIDVNVHPAKSEISFADVNEIEDFVEKSILGVLNSERAIPRLSSHTQRAQETVFHIEETLKEEDTLTSTSGGKDEKIDAVDINSLLSTINRSNYNIIQINENIDKNGFSLFKEDIDDHYESSLNIAELQPLTCLFATYILAAIGDSVYIIDQHAAHERLNFERFRNDYEKGETAMQILMTPYLFTPPPAVKDLSEHIEFFKNLGFEIDEFGENTWAARTFPAFIDPEEAEAFLLESLDALGSDDNIINAAAAEKIMMRACKASVKANKLLSDEEIRALLHDLSKCRNPYTCPHGRPVFIKLTISDIERLFKRA